jgi:hypothetical protein
MVTPPAKRSAFQGVQAAAAPDVQYIIEVNGKTRRQEAMMNVLTGPALALAAGTLLAASAFGQLCDKDDLPCQSQVDAQMVETMRQEAQASVEAKREFNQKIAAARARYFATYPDKPGAAEAKKTFMGLLQAKDVWYLQLTLLSEGINLPGRRDTVINFFDFLAGGQQIDGGIRSSAKDEFNYWVLMARKFVFRLVPNNPTAVFLLNADQIAKVLESTKDDYAKYVEMRDDWEYVTAGRTLPDYIVPAEYNTKQKYGVFLYFRFGQMPLPDAQATYAQMVKLLGANIVESAAEQVRVAPKTPTGTQLVVTSKPPVVTAPGGTAMPDRTVPASENVIGAYGGPLFAFETLATRGDDRRYLLDLIADNNYAAPRDRSRHIGKWDYAGTAYARLVSAFGEQAVLDAARRVHGATKRRTDGALMDAQAIGATRNDPYPAFEDILARGNPKGYVRALLAARQKLNSAAEVDAAYQKFVSENGEAAVLSAAKTLAAGKPHPAYAGDFDVLARSLSAPPSAPAPPAEAQIDDPDYVAWKGFSEGAKASYLLRALVPARPGSDQLIPGRPMVRFTYRFRSISDRQVNLWLTEIVYDSGSGAAHPPHDSEAGFPAKLPARLAPAPAQTGQETLTIGGRSVVTRWQSVPSNSAKCPAGTKTWTSPEVPGGLVRKTEVDPYNCAAKETILESFEGTRLGGIGRSAEPVAAAAPPSQPETLARPALRSPAQAPVVPSPVPGPARAAAPPQPSRPAVASDPRMALRLRYTAALTRIRKDQGSLGQKEAKLLRAGSALPPDIVAARGSLIPALQTAMGAIGRNDVVQGNESLQALEGKLARIEEYLGQ